MSSAVHGDWLVEQVDWHGRVEWERGFVDRAWWLGERNTCFVEYDGWLLSRGTRLMALDAGLLIWHSWVDGLAGWLAREDAPGPMLA